MKKRILAMIGVVVITGLICVFPIKNEIKKEAKYTSAIKHIDAGEWAEAHDLFWDDDLYHYKDSAKLADYCNARISYDSGNVYMAKIYLKNVDHVSTNQGEIDRFKAEVNDAYEEQYKNDRKQESKATTEKKTTPNIPYVGMSESQIDSTSWGKHGKLRNNGAKVDGEYVTVNLYDFYVDGHLQYTVRCAKNRVLSIYDWGDSFHSSSGKSSSSKSATTRSDPYDVYDYSNPDDFYYDHYVDFVDFEDAEDYFYKHN